MKKIISLILFTLVFHVTPLLAGSVPTITKDELKTQLSSQDLVIVDVRTGKDWSSSEFKIQGAVRPQGKDLAELNEYPKGSTFVFYCA